MDPVINYQCPNCGGPLAFGIESQKWECHFCDSSFDEAEKESFAKQEGSGEQQAGIRPETGEMFSEVDTVRYTCPSCGGSVLADANTAATFCVYCHNPTIIAGKLSGEYQPAMLIPFKQTKEAAVEALRKLCKGRPFMPRLFKEAAAKGEVAGLYVPYWLFGGDHDAMLMGTATNVTTWRDPNYIYTKTDSYRVERAARIPVRRVPVDGSQRMDDAIMEAIEPYDYSDLIPFSMQYLSGHQAECYDVDANSCRVRYEQRVDKAIGQTMRALVSGYSAVQVQSLQQNCQSPEVAYVMLPVWTVMAPFRGKTYSFTMNAQTGKIVGRLPVDWAKVGLWFGGITAAATLLFWLGGFLL